MLANIRNRFNYFRRKKAQPAQLEQLQAELLAESTPNLPYLVLIVGSCAIATFGLLALLIEALRKSYLYKKVCSN
ncbi:MAG TPA: hypothetical protein DC064_21265 [Cyanobacteria bacterium UBA9273]|nr:hypothetical protein [Cyanobacteria bacterium UBA9273]